MPRARQFRERPAVIHAGDVWLEGLYANATETPALLVCPPEAGGLAMGMDAPPVAELAFAAWSRQMPSLRFQHRGVGASTGTCDPSAALEGATHALAHLVETAGPLFAIASYLTGASTALALAKRNPRCRSVVLIAPPPSLDLPELSAPILAVLPERETDAHEFWRGRADSVLIADGSDAHFSSGATQACLHAVDWLRTNRHRR